MHAREQSLPRDGANQRHEHVGLGIERVALRAEKRIRRAAADQRRPPFNQLIARANRQADAEDNEEQPFAGAQRRAPDENFPSDDRGDESLKLR